MATATKQTETKDVEVKRIEKRDVNTYTLTLEQDEADVLVDVLSQVGGIAETSRRGLVQKILKALGEAGVRYSSKRCMDIDRRPLPYRGGYIFFNETKTS